MHRQETYIPAGLGSLGNNPEQPTIILLQIQAAYPLPRSLDDVMQCVRVPSHRTFGKDHSWGGRHRAS